MLLNRQAPGRDFHKHFSLAPARGDTKPPSHPQSAPAYPVPYKTGPKLAMRRRGHHTCHSCHSQPLSPPPPHSHAPSPNPPLSTPPPLSSPTPKYNRQQAGGGAFSSAVHSEQSSLRSHVTINPAPPCRPTASADRRGAQGKQTRGQACRRRQGGPYLNHVVTCPSACPGVLPCM